MTTITEGAAAVTAELNLTTELVPECALNALQNERARLRAQGFPPYHQQVREQ
jgi:hypothetical protein